MRALPKERPTSLTAPPDGQSLERIIGELQSIWGVPQYPQEFRITIKVAEERDQRPEPSVDDAPKEVQSRGNGGGPRREKAPAAPLMRMGGTAERSEKTEGGAPKKRRRGRRRRRGGGSGPPQPGGADQPGGQPGGES